MAEVSDAEISGGASDDVIEDEVFIQEIGENENDDTKLVNTSTD